MTLFVMPNGDTHERNVYGITACAPGDQSTHVHVAFIDRDSVLCNGRIETFALLEIVVP